MNNFLSNNYSIYSSNEFGIEFQLRDDDCPSQSPANKIIPQKIPTTHPRGKNASKEIDIYRYVNYYNEERQIDKENLVSNVVHSLGFPDLSGSKSQI